MPRILQTLILIVSVNFLSAQISPIKNSEKKATITSIDSCTNWLYLPTQPAAVEIGQLNVIGNQITVEALINRTTPYTGGILYAGDVVSKHSTPADANYLLRPNEAEITTTNGYFRTPDICEIDLNKTYHIAMVYDGVTLKFFRNGFLMSQVAATGDLYQNTWPTRIGYYFSEIYNTNFIGYINEVRIWNVARTQTEIQNNMSTSLPNPTTQPGLLAYYQFSDLLNKQGNPAWNGAFVGSAVPNQLNPTCPGFVADSCCPTLNGQLVGSQVCNGSPAYLTFSSTSTTGPFTLKFTNGIDTFTQSNVLNNIPFSLTNSPTSTTNYQLISIKDTSNCGPTYITGDTASIIVDNCSLSCNNWLNLPSDPSYVSIGDLNIPGNQITIEAMVNLTTPFTGGPTIGSDVVTKYNNPSDVNYLLRFNNAYITTDAGFYGTPDFCQSDTNKTYHIAMVYDGSTLKFYRNGYLMSQVAATGNLYQNNWPTWIGNYYSQDYNTNFIGYINEVRIWNIARTQAQIQAYRSTSLPSPATQTGLLAYYIFDDLLNKQGNSTWNGILGGAAAINQTNSECKLVTDSCCSTLQGSLIGDTICRGGNATLTFNASNGSAPFTLTYSDGINSYTKENVLSNTPFLITSQPIATTTYTLLSIQDASSCAATTVSGIYSAVIVNPLPQAKLTGTNVCTGENANLLFTSTAGTAPFSIIYNNGITDFILGGLSGDTTFLVSYPLIDTTVFKLVTIKDANGCADSAGLNTEIDVYPLPQGGIAGSTACSGDSATITFTATSGSPPFTLNISQGPNDTSYSGIQSGIPFKIAPLFNNSNISLQSIIDNTGCSRSNGFQSSMAIILVNPSPQLEFDTLKSVCMNDSSFHIIQARENSGIAGTGIFSGQGVDSSGLFSPSMAGIGVHEITYTYTATDGCAATKGQPILVNKNPVGSAGADLIACANTSFQLSATGGDSYLWSPPEGLNNPHIPNPTVTISSSTLFTVIVTDLDGCSVTDSVFVTLSPVGKNLYVVPNAFTPNGDGKNDCFGIQRWGSVNLLQFSVYNRYGELIFNTKNPFDCWDGTFHGNKQETGTYVYIIRAQTPCGEVNLKGTVVLIR